MPNHVKELPIWVLFFSSNVLFGLRAEDENGSNEENLYSVSLLPLFLIYNKEVIKSFLSHQSTNLYLTNPTLP